MYNSNKEFIAAFEIFVMVIATVSFAYFIHESEGPEKKVIQSSGRERNPLLFVLKIVTKIIGDDNLASATQYLGIDTCIAAKDGKICQEYPMAECNDYCASPCIPASRANVVECEEGLCYDSNEGNCFSHAPRVACESTGGAWYKANANPAECKKGCCLLGNGAVTDIVTEKTCANMAARLGMVKVFRTDITKVQECMAVPRMFEEGACVLGKDALTGKRECKFTTLGSCATFNGEFYPGFLCSNSELDTKCERQATSRCVEGRDEIYWFDSCGNRENIYDVNKVKSWNDGKVLGKSESCEIGTSLNPLAHQETCGNCEYLKGSKCGNRTEDEGLDVLTQKYVCRDLRCDEDRNGIKDRKHGETWCAYQGRIGIVDGRSVDVPGSNHWQKMCWEGEIVTNPCESARRQICVQWKNETTKETSAECLSNSGLKCLNLNGEGEGDECKENPDCNYINVEVDDYFDFNICVPKYPIGGVGSSCEMGSQKCTMYYVRKFGSVHNDYECRANCKCKNYDFTKEMSDLCMSLGDCGAEVNYIGKMSKSYSVSRAPSLKSDYLKEISEYWKTKKGEYVDADREENKGYFPTDMGVDNSNTNDYDSYNTQSSGDVIDEFHNTMFGDAGSITWSQIAKDFMVLVMAATGVWLGIYIIMLVTPQVFEKWFGWGKVKKKKVKYTCGSWDAPSGGADCGKCGKDGFPCNEYSCNSLGSYCQLKDKDTDNEKCISVDPDDIVPPTITPFPSSLSEGYQIKDETATGYSIRDSDGKCIQEYNSVTFGVNLNKYGKCRYSFKPNENYSIMGEGLDEEFEEILGESDFMDDFTGGWFGNSQFGRNQTMTMTMPPLEMLGASSYNPDAAIPYTIYVKCENGNGYANVADYAINLCVRPGINIDEPKIVHQTPQRGIIANNATKQSVRLMIHEPSECKWDSTDKNYSLMKYNLTCFNDYEDRMVYPGGVGWPCNMTSSMPTGENTSTYFVRCIDQPWEENESKRNAMREGYKVELNRTGKLEIVSVIPDGETLIFGQEPVAVKLEVETEGGDEDTINCYWALNDSINHMFSVNGEKYHSMMFDSLFGGEQKFRVSCWDSVDNFAKQDVSFYAEIDKSGPKITRIYNNMGALIVITDEDSDCAISLEGCGFIYENATRMTGSAKYHSVPVALKTNYYILCKDKFSNNKGECDLKIKLI